jgi:hypothetical protein
MPGAVAQPVILATLEVGGSWLEASLGKKFARLHSQSRKVGHGSACLSVQHTAGVNRRMVVQADLDINARPYMKNI